MGQIYIDSCVFIEAFVSSTPMASRRLIDEIFARPHVRAATSELSLAELLAPTKRALSLSPEQRRNLYTTLFDDGDFIDLLPVARDVLLETATLRVACPRRLPDAINMATAVIHGCRFFVSFDWDARRLPSRLIWVTPTTDEIDDLFKVLDA